MENLIDLKSYPVCLVLNNLLQDKTTRQNIIFATNSYNDGEHPMKETDEISLKWLKNYGDNAIRPRVLKSLEIQAKRTKNKAEVFTPAWICNKMNNHCDSVWFERDSVFNEETSDNGWVENTEPIAFPEGKTWKDYVDSRRIEITCGEAPYIVSRYDAATGDIIPISHRIGILDRKLRVVNENAQGEEEWFTWVIRAYQSTYGFEFQGDNLLVARINCLNTFCDYLYERWNRYATKEELRKIANIIAWNLWQMDGLTGAIPFNSVQNDFQQLSFFECFGVGEPEPCNNTVLCRIYDWRDKSSLEYNSLKGR